MPAEFTNCVDALLKAGNSKDKAYAICTAQYMKRHHGNTPQHDEKMQGASVEQDLIDAMGWLYETVTAARNMKKAKDKQLKGC